MTSFGAMVAQEMVELGDGVGNVLVADAIDHVDVFAGVQVVEAQTVLRGGGSVIRGADGQAEGQQ